MEFTIEINKKDMNKFIDKLGEINKECFRLLGKDKRITFLEEVIEINKTSYLHYDVFDIININPIYQLTGILHVYNKNKVSFYGDNNSWRKCNWNLIENLFNKCGNCEFYILRNIYSNTEQYLQYSDILKYIDKKYIFLYKKIHQKESYFI